MRSTSTKILGMCIGLLLTPCSLTLTREVARAEAPTKLRVHKVDDAASGVVKWVQQIGSDAGSPVVSERYVVVGTDNGKYDATSAGAMMCFDSASGRLRWQVLHHRLPRRENDRGFGLMCEPVVTSNRVFYQNNRGEAVCVDLIGKSSEESTSLHWKVDFVGQMGVFKRDAGDVGNPTPSPLLVGSRLFCVTGNGSIFGIASAYPKSSFVPNPEAPSFAALDAKTGKVLWKSSIPGRAVCYGQWGSPASLKIDGKSIVIFPGGDGVLYLLCPETGGVLGSVVLNGPTVKSWSKEGRGDVLFCSHRPLVVDHLIYVALSQDLETSAGVVGPILCIDAKEVLAGSCRSKTIRWAFQNGEFASSLGELASIGERLYAVSSVGSLVCLDRHRGTLKWLVNQCEAGRIAGVTIHKDQVYVVSGSSLWVFADNDYPWPVARYDFANLLMARPFVTETEVFVSSSGRLWCLKK